MSKVRYCWLTPELDFSLSWSEEDHEKFFDKDMQEKANKENWRLIKYEVLTGQDFEFPYGARLINGKAVK